MILRQILAVLLLSTVILRECNATEFDEVARVLSPDGLVDAVLTRGNYGATVDYVYRVHLVRAGGATTPDDAVVVADHVVEPAISWVHPKFLTFSYQEARIFGFRNFWQSEEVQNSFYIVEIRLKPATDNYSLGTE